MGCHMSLTGCPLSSMQLALDTGLALLLNWGFIIWLLIVSMQLAFDTFLYLIIVRVPDDSDSQNLLPSITAGRAVNIYVYLYIYIFICLSFHMFIFSYVYLLPFNSRRSCSQSKGGHCPLHRPGESFFYCRLENIKNILWFQNNTKIYGKWF